MKKSKSKSGLVFHIVLSIIVWQIIVYIFLNMALTAMVDKSLLTDSLSFIIVKYNLLWIVANCIVLFISYLFNRKNTTDANDLPSAKISVLIWFCILTFGANIKRIITLAEYSAVVEITCIVVHIAILYFLNNWLFKKYIEN